MLQFLIGALDFLARGKPVITIDSCYNEAHDDLTFNVIGATMESPLQNPLACLYKPRVCGNKAELLRWDPCGV